MSAFMTLLPALLILGIALAVVAAVVMILKGNILDNLRSLKPTRNIAPEPKMPPMAPPVPAPLDLPSPLPPVEAPPDDKEMMP